MTSAFNKLPSFVQGYIRGPSNIRVIVTGSRTFNDYALVTEAVNRLAKDYNITQIVSGCARGADKLGERYAQEKGIPLAKFPADWETLGKRAGFIRNKQMAEYSDVLIAFWDGSSRGTQHMIKLMLKAKKPVILHTNDKWYCYKGEYNGSD